MLPRSCFSVFGFLVLLNLVSADELFLGVERSRIERVIEMGYSMDLGTEEEIGRLAEAYPESPVPALLEAGYLYWMQSYLEWDEESEAKFEERAAVALDGAKAFLKAHKGDADAEFAVATVELMQVIYFVENRRWWPAFWKSRSSLKTMKSLLAEDGELHDAKMPLGMVNCYMAKTPGYLKPLAFLMRFKGDMDLGLRYMREARDGGLFFKVDAGYYLAGVFMELKEDRQGARDEIAKLVERFPRNLKFQSMLAELDRGLGNQEAARDRSLLVLADERLVGFPPIELRTLTSLLWSSLGSQRFELAMETSYRLEAMVALYPALASEAAWASYARAEALLGLGEREKALALWGSISKELNELAYAGAQKRLTEVGAK